MRQYIDKDVLVAEINRQHKILMQTDHTYGAQFVLGFRQACRQIIDYLGTLEVKEVDGEPRTSAENNDQIAYGHIADNDKNK